MWEKDAERIEKGGDVMENKKRLIDANALDTVPWEDEQDAIYAIKNAPTIDAVEVVHGRWIPIIDEPTPLRKMPMLSGYRCSVCGRYEEKEEPYCNCGAKMDGDVNA